MDTKLDIIFKAIPLNCFPWFEKVLLYIYLTFSIIAPVILKTFDRQTSFTCNDKMISNFQETSLIKNIESSCLKQYQYETWDNIYVVSFNFFFPLLWSVVYGLSVSHRIENFDKFLSERSSEVRKVASSSWAFWYYIIYLIGRLIGLAIFVTVLFPGMFPLDYTCSWRPTTNEKSSFNIIFLSSYNETFVNCKIRDGKSERWIVLVVAVNVLSIIMTISQLMYLKNEARNDNFFTSDKEFFTVYLFQKRAKFRNWIKEIKNKFHRNKLFDIHNNVGNAQISVQNLEDIYVNVIMQGERQLSKAYPETHERHEILHCHFKLNENAKKLTRATDIFKSIPNSKSHPCSILVIGRPGIGKTMLTKKLIHEWTTNEDNFLRHKLVMLLQCRAIKDKYITFEKMLRSCVGLSFEQFSDIYEFIMLNPERTVLVVDGLDELNLDNENLQTDDSGSPNEKRAVITHLSMLVEGKLLPDVTVLITSRPTAERKFRDMEFARTVEILGFFEDEIKEFVEKFCHEDRNMADRILNKIEISLELRSFCYIPINTKIVCMTLKECLADHENYSPKSMTELYDRAIKVLLWQSHPLLRGVTTEKDYLRIPLPSELDKDLQEIKSVAMEGLKDGRLIFERKSTSNLKNLENCGIFNKIYDDERHLYCFLHFTLQEFFAAWYIVDDWQNIGTFLNDLVEDPKWHLVIKFAAGLVIITTKKTGEDISFILERLEKWTSHLFDSESNKALGFLGMKCLYELQEDDEMRSACKSNNFSQEKISIDNVSFTPLDSNTFFEFLSKCRQLRKLEFFSCQFLDNHSVVRLSKYLSNGTAYNLFSLKIISCRVNNISKHLSEALKSENCKLTEMELHNDNIDDDGAKSLSEALKTKNCKLTELSLSFNNIGDEVAKSLSETLKSENCKLSKLYLNHNNIGDGGAQYLSESLKSESCKLIKLDVFSNNIGKEGAKSLSEALKTENCKVVKLSVGFNNIGDEGAKSVSEALKSENCKLTELDLSRNNIGSEGAKSLSKALTRKNCKLTELCLVKNNIGDGGAKYLSIALKSENFKLTDLNLSSNNIGSEGANSLSKALKRKNCKLTELSLVKNNIGDEGVKSLSEALKSENCKLTKLSLDCNYIGNKGAKYLSEALKSENCKLTELDLYLNNIGDEGVKSLSEALKMRIVILLTGILVVTI